MTSSQPQLRRQILQVLEAALRAVEPAQAVRSHVTLDGDILGAGGRTYCLAEIDRLYVVGAGKAGTPMATALAEILGPRITAGVVNVKYGHTGAKDGRKLRFARRPVERWHGRRPATAEGRPAAAGKPGETATPWASVSAAERVKAGPIRILEAGHPVPDAAGQIGAESIAGLLHGLTERDLVFVLISGGGSALLPLPVPGVSLADYQSLTGALLRCGADITEINTIRKHCSQLQGGQLARLAAPAQVISLVLSDVVGAPLDAIASGPTVPDRTTFGDAIAILKRYGIIDAVPGAVRNHLVAGASGAVPETPKPGDPSFDRVTNVVVGDNASAARAAVAEARRLGFNAALLTTFIQGEAREIGKAVAGLAQGIACGQSDYTPPACLILGGETTVTVRGQGVGGRNQELALAAAIALDGFHLPDRGNGRRDRGAQVAVVSLGTDGTDGPTDAAGGIAWPDTLARGRALGLDARAALAMNDSYHFLGALGDLLVSGPTNTNVNDLIFVFVSA